MTSKPEKKLRIITRAACALIVTNFILKNARSLYIQSVIVIGLRSVIIRVTDEIGRPRGGSPICESRVCLRPELDDTKSYKQLFINVKLSEDLRKDEKLVKGINCFMILFKISGF